MEAQQIFEILAREHAGMLWAYLNSLVRDRSVADDLFQETLLTAWRTIDRYDKSRPFGPWLRGIAGRLVMAHRRLAGRIHVAHAEEIEAIDALHGRVAVPTGDTWDEKLDGLRRCIEKLPDSHQQVVRMYYWDELDCAAIAQRLDEQLEAIKKRLQRARTALADCLKSHLSTQEAVTP